MNIIKRFSTTKISKFSKLSNIVWMQNVPIKKFWPAQSQN